MLRPLSQWICDNCGKLIDNAEAGYVIWKVDAEMRKYSFRVVHQKICDDQKYSSSMPVKEFFGLNGSAYLTSMLSYGSVKLNAGESPRKPPVDMDEFSDFFRRMQLPYYEEARTKFGDEGIQERFGDSNETYPYLPDGLKSIMEVGGPNG